MCFFKTVPNWQTFSPKKSEEMLTKIPLAANESSSLPTAFY
ncbi:hypothetical protein D922_01600 [Enterococcus faecalis 06-MB-DW-09]|nr:hypothetical protein D922_01600 [Enterococcus faecalis 06-MB-DW-09]